MKFGTGVLDVYQKCRGMKKSRKAMIDAMKNELETTFHDAYKAGKVYLMAASSSSEEEVWKHGHYLLQKPFLHILHPVLIPVRSCRNHLIHY